MNGYIKLTNVKHWMSLLKRVLSIKIPSQYQKQEKGTLELLVGSSQASVTLDGEILKVEIGIEPHTINLLRVLYEMREIGLDQQTYKIIDSKCRELESRIVRNGIPPDELWDYLLGEQPIANLPDGKYVPTDYEYIRVDEQGKIYFNGLNVTFKLKSKPQ